MHEQGPHEAKCVKHITNGQYMINMHNHGSPQNWYSSESKTENFIWAFYQTLRVYILHMNVKQCMNIWKSCLNTCYFHHNGPTSKANHYLKQNLIKMIDKN